MGGFLQRHLDLQSLNVNNKNESKIVQFALKFVEDGFCFSLFILIFKVSKTELSVPTQENHTR